MNYIEEFMKDNDIEMGEEFNVLYNNNKIFETNFHFDNTFYLLPNCIDANFNEDAILRNILSGYYSIKKIPVEPKTVWDLKKGDTYYVITSLGKIFELKFTQDSDKKFREIGNAFLKREEAELEVERRKCESIMLKYGTRDMMSLGGVNTPKYFIKYSQNEDIIEFVYNYTMTFQGPIYFKSKELARKAIEECGEERLKKYVFNVKEDQ